jgi:hypothetical protein
MKFNFASVKIFQMEEKIVLIVLIDPSCTLQTKSKLTSLIKDGPVKIKKLK